MFTDPQEHWVSRGILISIASLFELYKAIGIEFKGNGEYNKGSICGSKAEKRGFIADADYFEECINEIKDLRVELRVAIGYFRNFRDMVSIQNLQQRLIEYKRYPDLKKAIHGKEIEDAIQEFTFNFVEVHKLAELFQASYRNRTSHLALGSSYAKAYIVYHHAMMSRFLQLVEKCCDYPKSQGWWTTVTPPPGDEKGSPLAMINSLEEDFKSDTKKVFEFLGNGPPLHELRLNSDNSSDDCKVIQQPDVSSPNESVTSASKADLYEIVDFIRETHNESSSRFAWLEEQISLLVADKAEDIKSSLLRPWMNKDVEAILSLIASQSADQAGQTESSDSSVKEVKTGFEDCHDNKTSVIDNYTTTPMERLENLYKQLRTLRNEIRNNLHQANPRFEYYHCVLQSNIVLPALNAGVCNYDQLKETEEFQARIVNLNGSFMLDMQEEKYREKIDRLLSQNPFKC